jgi:hypothetical protein
MNTDPQPWFLHEIFEIWRVHYRALPHMSYLGVELELDALFGHDTLELFTEEEKRILLYKKRRWAQL